MLLIIIAGSGTSDTLINFITNKHNTQFNYLQGPSGSKPEQPTESPAE